MDTLNTVNGLSLKRWFSPAKLNLFLHVIGRRPDGYHHLQTVFQFLDYGDTLTFTVRHDTAHITLTPFFPDIPVEENLVVRAARRLQTLCGISNGVDIHLEKCLPLGSGLGGGSSNAATTLIALNTLWNLNLSPSTLTDIGLSLGADVPIFLYGKAAFAEGIGEKLQAIPLNEPWYAVLIPPCHVNTAKIFSDNRLTRNTPAIKIDDYSQGQGHNDCEPVVRRAYPAVAFALDWLAQFKPAQMTGTGCCVFAACHTEQEARAIIEQLPTSLRGFAAKGCNLSPLFSKA